MADDLMRLDLAYPEPAEMRRGSRYDYGVGVGYEWLEHIPKIGYKVRPTGPVFLNLK